MVRSALKEVELDSSRRVELDDYVDVRLTSAILAVRGKKYQLNDRLIGFIL